MSILRAHITSFAPAAAKPSAGSEPSVEIQVEIQPRAVSPTRKINIGWCENDFQIDISTAGKEETNDCIYLSNPIRRAIIGRAVCGCGWVRSGYLFSADR